MHVRQPLWRNLLSVSATTGLLSLLLTSVTYANTTDIDRKNISFAKTNICVSDVIQIPRILTTQAVTEDLSTKVEADSLETNESVVKLNGNAQLIQGNKGIFADSIVYYTEQHNAAVNGNVRYYTESGDEISADSLNIDIDTFVGSADNTKIKIAATSLIDDDQKYHDFVEDYSLFAPLQKAEYRRPAEESRLHSNKTYIGSRATAKKLELEGEGYKVLYDATLTSCNQHNEDVVMHAKTIELDHTSGIGTARGMSIRFKKAPIFYFPYISFPITNERKSGFLFPEFGYKKSSGTTLSVPYYINIAPNHDATVTPTLFSRRGVQLHGEYRYLTDNYMGEIEAGILPQDRVFGRDRYAYKLLHDHQISEKWSGEVELQGVSDSRYVSDFNTNIETAATSFIPQKGELHYRGDIIDLNIETNTYVPINSSVALGSRSYQTRPEINLSLEEQTLGFAEFSIDTEYTEFRHADNHLVSGRRIRFRPSIDLPMENAYGFITPKISVQHIDYSLKNVGVDSNRTPSVTVPIYSVDGGLFFERFIQRNDTQYTQTLEPRLFYVNIPKKLQQNSFPVFDTSIGSTNSLGHFFRENRFFGGDRIGDTEHVVVGLVSRFINDQTGLQRLKLSLGQIFYMSSREVKLSPDTASQTNNQSEFLAEISAGINKNWNINGFSRFDNHKNKLTYINANIDYYYSNRRNSSISYTRKADDDNGQINLKFTAPLGQKWQLKTRYDYSLEDKETRTVATQIAYDDCCWAISFTAKRFLNGSGVQQNSFFFTFELDDLGSIRSYL